LTRWRWRTGRPLKVGHLVLSLFRPPALLIDRGTALIQWRWPLGALRWGTSWLRLPNPSTFLSHRALEHGGVRFLPSP
jgi:hypothetical protein